MTGPRAVPLLPQTSGSVRSSGRTRGFTMIEVMIGIAIVAILAAISVPSYSDYMRRSRLSSAFEQLGGFRMRMEQSYQDNNNYGSGGNCALTAPTASSYFSYACALTNSGQGFTATATGSGQMSGYTFTTDAAGTNTTTAFPRGSSLPAPCWWTRVGDC